MEQYHLKTKDRINLGSYYTSTEHTNTVWKFVRSYIDDSWTVLDSSCGYGNFLSYNTRCQKIGNDIDSTAVSSAKTNIPTARFFNHNALYDVSREKYGISKDSRLCIVGNPPYNDKTSMIRNDIKKVKFSIDTDIDTRDLGVSFLRSYAKLDADIVCVLHPLSYLIKKANFNCLKDFAKNYKLVKTKVISSDSFSQTSKTMQFPIVIALYQKEENGMSYDYIQNFDFELENSLIFKQNNYDYISNYIAKYPNKYATVDRDSILFWTMRDINALRRNRTFVNKNNQNAIIVKKDKLDYYIYVDVFKRYASCVPYYLGNCDVIIDDGLFKQYKKYFILDSLFYQHHLRKYYAVFDFEQTKYKSIAKQYIEKYFKILLGEHYANS